MSDEQSSLRQILFRVLFVVAVVLALYFGYRTFFGTGPRDSIAYLSKEVTIRCSETGKEWKMTRALLEQQLYGRQGVLDPSEGITNPDTGRPTGFPVRSEWEDTITRINAEKEEMLSGRKTRKR